MTFAHEEPLRSTRESGTTPIAGTSMEEEGDAEGDATVGDAVAPSDVKDESREECADQRGKEEGGEEASSETPSSSEIKSCEALVSSSRSSLRARKNHNLAVSFSERTNISGRSHRSENGVVPRLKSSRQPYHPQSPSFASTSVNSIMSVGSLKSAGPCSCFAWTKRRIQVACLGCTSSFGVLAVRVYLDIERSTYWSSTYLIHSIIILFDMLLIHLFTFSPWLSTGGELVTVACFLSYHFTRETVFELLETTLIAALCSIHMIMSRSKHWDHEEELVEHFREQQAHWLDRASHHRVSFHDVPTHFSTNDGSEHRALRPESSMNVREGTDISHVETAGTVEPHESEQEHDIESNVRSAHDGVSADSKIPSSQHDSDKGDVDIESNVRSDHAIVESDNKVWYSQNISDSLPSHVPLYMEEEQEDESGVDALNPARARTCWHHFFEHFLDGSAGVMYTSFFGLILDELISYGVNKGSCPPASTAAAS